MFVLDKLGYCLGMLSPDQSFEGGARCIISICDDVGSSRQKRGGSADFVGK
jgi:hypothetical protein